MTGRDEKSAAVLAVEGAGEYLARVTRWLAGRSAHGQSLAANPVLRQRLARAATGHRAARALLDRGLLGAAVSASVAVVRVCESVHAGAGVFDPAPNAVRELFVERRWEPVELGPLSRLNPELAERVAFALVQHEGDTPGEVAAVVAAVSPPETTTLLDDLVVAEVMARLLAPGLAARVMTHRQVVRSYLTGPGAAPVAARILAERRALTSVAVTEPHTGSDLSALRTQLRWQGGRLLLDGTKTYVTGGADSDWTLVAARREGRTVLVWVDPGAPGVTRRPLETRAWRGAGFAEIAMDAVLVSEVDVHAGRGTDALLAGLVRERVILAAQQIGYARRWLADLPAEARERFTWSLFAAQVLLEEALTAAELSMVDSSMAKLLCCEVAAEIAAARSAALAGRAPVGELLDDEASAMACTFAGGTAEVNLAVVEGVLVPAFTGDRGST